MPFAHTPGALVQSNVETSCEVTRQKVPSSRRIPLSFWASWLPSVPMPIQSHDEQYITSLIQKYQTTESERITKQECISAHCVCCFDRPPTIQFSECGHIICCEVCYIKLNTSSYDGNRKCPVCRTNVTHDEVREGDVVWSMMDVLMNFDLEHRPVQVQQRIDNASLFIVCRCGEEKLTSLLIHRGAQLNQVNIFGGSPLLVACLGGHTNTVSVLLEAGATTSLPEASTNCRRLTALHTACHSGDTDIATLLLDHRAQVNQYDQYGYTPLHVACMHGCMDIATLLLQRNAHINQVTQTGICFTPLHIACLGAKLDIVKLLLKHDACVVDQEDHFGCTPLYIACEQGHTEVISILLSNNADVDHPCHRGLTPVHTACHGGHTDTVTLLLDNDAQVNKYDNDGYLPLHDACMRGDADIAATLLKHDAQVIQYDKDGLTPLHIACLYGHADIVTVLLDQNAAHVNHLTTDGKTPLYIACEQGHPEVTFILLKKGADVHHPCDMGLTPLHIVCFEGTVDIVPMLLEYGANVYETFGPGLYTPLSFARMNGHKLIVSLLVHHLHRVGNNNNSPPQASIFSTTLQNMNMNMNMKEKKKSKKRKRKTMSV
jgi:ankyrin repeat protein